MPSLEVDHKSLNSAGFLPPRPLLKAVALPGKPFLTIFTSLTLAHVSYSAEAPPPLRNPPPGVLPSRVWVRCRRCSHCASLMAFGQVIGLPPLLD